MVLCRTFYAESEERLGLEQREGYIPILSGIKTVSGVQSWSHFKSVWKVSTQGYIYTKRQHQCCDDASDTTVIESHGVTPDWGCNPFRATPLFLMRTVSLASLKSCCIVDADTWCKQALIPVPVPVPVTVSVIIPQVFLPWHLTPCAIKPQRKFAQKSHQCGPLNVWVWNIERIYIAECPAKHLH